MSSRIHTALSELSASVDRLDRVLSSAKTFRAPGTEHDLFSIAESKETVPCSADILNGKILDTARMARAVDRAIEKIELLLGEE